MVLFILFIVAVFVDEWWNSPCGFNLYFPDVRNNDDVYLFIFINYFDSLLNCLFKSCPIFLLAFFFFLVISSCSLSWLCWMYSLQKSICILPFYYCNAIFNEQKFLIYINLYVSVFFSFLIGAFLFYWTCLRNLCLS